MQGKPKRKRQKRCKCCRKLFQLDARTKGKQKYCSKPECQRKRQRQNERDWRKRNPDCVEYQYQQTRQWNKAHPDYSRQKRAQNPQLLKHNSDQTRHRMQEIREKRVFDKSKVILTQVVGSKPDKCYLTRGSKWLHVRLTKASPLSKRGSVGDNRNMCKRVANRLPKGRLYDLSCILE
ncbi:MAG: hypothetical protein KAR05_10895 [Candidatus Omnitrophica bacterium]|nr:hypothetical protein [Candidatus Omnitrophota bacterium]